jgi:hypothetical protein
MDFSDIEKSQREAFDYLIANSPESEAVKDVSVNDAISLMDELEKLQKYLSKLDLLLVKYSEKLGMDFSDVKIHLSNFSREINLDTEYLVRRHT